MITRENRVDLIWKRLPVPVRVRALKQMGFDLANTTVVTTDIKEEAIRRFQLDRRSDLVTK